MSTLTQKPNVDAFPVSINDIRDKYFDNVPLTEEEDIALRNYDKFRLFYLNDAPNDDVFEKRYFELQIKANLSSYTDFLNLGDLIGQ